jgi:SPP1 gp7 family putative phage head morphogenesis protein
MYQMLPPSGVERQYTTLIQGVASAMGKETLRLVKERGLLRNDGWSDDLDALIEYLLFFGASLADGLVLKLPEVYAMVNKFNDRQWRMVVKSGTGIDLVPGQSVPMGMKAYGSVTDPNRVRARFGLGVDVYRSEPWLAEKQKNWVAANSSLIKSVPKQYMAQVESAIRNGVLAGESSKSLANKIKEISGVTERRAKVIARDQIGKANAELTKERQTDLGVKKYTWVTAHDERVRGNPYGRFPKAVPSHYARDGKIFEWDKPPDGGHAGMAVLCRCHSSPIFPDMPEDI